MSQEPGYRLQEIDPTWTFAEPMRPTMDWYASIGARLWRFLDYGPDSGDAALLNWRWLIASRPDIESFEMFSPWPGAQTNERALGQLAEEAGLAQRAIAEIRDVDGRAREAEAP